jgi:hypothetical protein
VELSPARTQSPNPKRAIIVKVIKAMHSEVFRLQATTSTYPFSLKFQGSMADALIRLWWLRVIMGILI